MPVDAGKDTYVDAAAPSSNFGGGLRLNTLGGALPARTFLGFTRPPVGAAVELAKLSLRVPTDVQGEVANLRWPDASSLSWDSGAVTSGSGTDYDVVSGLLSDAASLWPAASDLCVASGSISTTTLDSTPQPLPGNGRYFLVRGRNGCGAGRFETASSGRDRVSAACP